MHLQHHFFRVGSENTRGSERMLGKKQGFKYELVPIKNWLNMCSTCGCSAEHDEPESEGEGEAA
jgi:hypothetical protein